MVDVFTSVAPAMPCSWSVDVSCCSTWSDYSTELQTAAAEYGAFTMWAATGRRFGLCTRTIRPCGRQCTNCANGYFWSEGMWVPYIFNGIWRNCWCGSNLGCCTCQPSCQVWLPGPVASIPATGITQDGAVVPVNSWRVDNGMWLVRTDDECWPDCQDYDADSGTNTLMVTYQQGLPVPAILSRAAGELACEWAKSCLGQPCRLPQRVQSISRQGITIAMVDVDSLLIRGFTGIQTVDQVIAMFNPYGLKSEMKISTPDAPVSRTVSF